MKDMALKKLDSEYKALKSSDRYVVAVKDEVTDALKRFCEQSPEFAQAVMQGGKLEDCLKAAIRQKKGNKLSDLAAYADAARFYFPGCALKCEFTLYLCGGNDQQRFQADEMGELTEVRGPNQSRPDTVVLDLFDLL